MLEFQLFPKLSLGTYEPYNARYYRTLAVYPNLGKVVVLTGTGMQLLIR